MLLLAADPSTSYTVGRLCAIVVLAVLTVALVRRAVQRRRAEMHAAASPVVPAVDPATSASVGPPGSGAPTAPAPSAPASHGGRPRTGWRSDAVAAVVFGALLAVALVQFADPRLGADDGPWDTPEGRASHAAFLQGCERTANPALDGYCVCLFDEVTSSPPYDTPASFAALDAAGLRARRLDQLPPELIAAARRCVERTRPAA